MRATSIIVFSILLSVSQAPALRAESPKPTPEEPPHRSELSVEVLSDEDIQPIRDAVVFVTAEGNGVDFEKSAHTNGKGVASFLEVPRVKVTVQVTATGRRTFGTIRKLALDKETMTVRLKRES